MRYTKADTASLAAHVWPKLYKTNPAKALKKAIGLQQWLEQARASGETEKVKTKVSPYKQTNQAQAYWVRQLSRIGKTHQTYQAQANPRTTSKSARPQATDLGRRIPYARGVKEVTGEKNWERALPKFKRFTAANFPKDGEAEIRVKDHESRGFTVNQIIKYCGEYQPWWELEKSNNAGKSALANKKRKGRVKRPKTDLRFKENRKHEKGYCQKCGKRVQRLERLCDDCFSGKPLLLQEGEEEGEEPKGILVTGIIMLPGASRAAKSGDQDTSEDSETRERDGRAGLVNPEVLEDSYKDIYEHLDGAD